VFNDLDLDDYAILDEEVQSISAFQTNAFVEQRQRHLPPKRNTS
jgi:hypothetical protein